MNKIDIIVPVYKGYKETKECLQALLQYPQKTLFELIVINDQSPEPSLVAYLEQLAKAKQITLLTNPNNLGFVSTVNRGMQLHDDRDVILLNSDTQVANDWLDRLHTCAYSNPKIATVTPFSNNATICSFPNFCKDNTLPDGTKLKTLDSHFKQANSGLWLEIPTAVGFCMYIRRDCLNEIGLFDEGAFGKGYGEENDFCMRAIYKDWKNVLCADVFVYHAGNVSFGDEHNDRKRLAMETLRELHPNYESLVHEHIAKDPAKIFRQRALLTCLAHHSKPLILYLTHNRAGGTERHLNYLIASLSEQIEVIIIKPSSDGSGVTEINYRGLLKFYFDASQEFDAMIDFLTSLKINQIHIHHTLGLHPAMFTLPERLELPWDFTLHDYYPCCPQINLIDLQGHYCGEPNEDGCNVCLKTRPSADNVSIETWRNNYKPLIEGARWCFAPSKDTAMRFKYYFPSANVLTVYHEAKLLHAQPPQQPKGSVTRLRVIVLGALSPMKGADFLEIVAEDAKRRNLPIDFILLGYCYRDMVISPHSNLEVIGGYKEEDLQRLITQHSADLVWFPALWPETYSYTLSAAIEAGLPIVAPNLGVFPERLYDRQYSWIIPWKIPAQQVNDFLMALKNSVFQGREFEHQQQFVSFIKPESSNFSYTTDYLMTPPKPLLETTPNLDQFIEQWQPRLTLVQPLATLVMGKTRYASLIFLIHLRQLKSLRWLVKRIPQSVQSRLKSWLLKNY